MYRFFFSKTANIVVTFRDKFYFEARFRCYSDRFEEDKLYQVYCNSTDRLSVKIPQEGRKKCVQVSHMSVLNTKLKAYALHDFLFI